MAPLRLVLLCALVLATLTSEAHGESRLIEWPLRLLDRLTTRTSDTSSDIPDAATVPPVLLGDVPIVSPPNHTAGYFKLNRTVDAQMFYFFFESRSRNPEDPLVLWTNGGPGCSSEVGVLFENGPYYLEENLTLSESVWGWDRTHNMIYIDQPINTGFSYSKSSKDTVHDETGVANDVLEFIWEFLAAHPEHAARDFYVTGESYGGHYVPAIAYRIFQANQQNEGPHINLKGLAVGDGLTDPAIQYGAYGAYALQNKLIGERVYNRMMALYPLCYTQASACSGSKGRLLCLPALYYCQYTQFMPIVLGNPGINYYDIRKKCDSALCYKEFDRLAKYLNQPEIQNKLGVNRRFVECSQEVHMQMMGDWMRNYDVVFPALLDEGGIKVMIYVGDQDLICNWVGNRAWVDKLKWNRSSDWDAESDREWSVNGKAAGMVKKVGPLTFVKVYQAGHMVPYDQPENAFNMIGTFTRDGDWFKDDASQAVATGHGVHVQASQWKDRIEDSREWAVY